MTIGLYLAVGHGVKPGGTFDPGAVSHGRTEHALAYQVCAAWAAALKRSGYKDFVWESAAGASHDPNFIGSTARANELGAQYCAEVHLNAGGGTGTETLIFKDTPGVTKTWASRSQAAVVKALRLPSRGVKARPDLYWLRKTTGHAILVEVLFIDGDADWLTKNPGGLTKAGEALAQAYLAQIGKPYKPACP